MIRRQPRENIVERAGECIPHVRRRQHPRQQHGDALVTQPIQNGVQIFVCGVRRQAAQRIVGAKFNDRQIGPIGHGPRKPGQPSRRRISGHPGIDDKCVHALVHQRRLELSREGIGFQRQAMARRQAVAQHHNGHRLRPRRRCRDHDHDSGHHCRIDRPAQEPICEKPAHRSQNASKIGFMVTFSGIPGTPNEPLVRLRGVALTLASAAGAVNILRGVDLNVAVGETLAIAGPSGSGKSTLLAVMTGLERPSVGSVIVAGHDLVAMDEDALALFRRNTVGIVFQSFHLIPTMTALENVAVPLELAGKPNAFTAAEASLDAAGLGERVGHYPSQLSGGEQQRVAVARAFAGAPALVIADEPTGNLDTTTGAAIIDLMFSIQAAQHTSLILITHDQAIAGRCDRLVQMQDGRVVQAAAVA